MDGFWETQRGPLHHHSTQDFLAQPWFSLSSSYGTATSLELDRFGDWRRSAQDKLHSMCLASFGKERDAPCTFDLLVSEKGKEDSRPHAMSERVFQ